MKRGFTLIETLVSVAILSIIASMLLPSLINTLSNQKKVESRNEMFLEARNQMEQVAGTAYRGNLDLSSVVSEKYETEIESRKLSEELVEITLKIKEKNSKENEVVFKQILPKKRIYIN